MDGYMQRVYLALESPWKEELLDRKWLEFAYAIGRFLSSLAWGYHLAHRILYTGTL